MCVIISVLLTQLFFCFYAYYVSTFSFIVIRRLHLLCFARLISVSNHDQLLGYWNRTWKKWCWHLLFYIFYTRSFIDNQLNCAETTVAKSIKFSVSVVSSQENRLALTVVISTGGSTSSRVWAFNNDSGANGRLFRMDLRSFRIRFYRG